jgi:hypothetical protein
MDKSMVGNFNPYNGGFMEANRVDPPSCANSPYLVTFDLVGNVDGKEERRQYRVYYCYDKQARHGFIYLPAKGEQYYQDNASVILLDDQVGSWHPATVEWEKFIGSLM